MTSADPSRASHIRLTSHNAGMHAPAIHWGAGTAAGRGPIPQGDPAYRAELDPNNNGIACDGGSSSLASKRRKNDP